MSAHIEISSCDKGTVVVVGLFPSLPNPAARSDSSIVYAGSFKALHRLLWTLLLQCDRRAASVS